MFGLKGHSLELNFHNAARRGGVVRAYINLPIKYRVLKGDVMHTESIWLQTEIGKRKVIIGVVYRKANIDIVEFQNSLLWTLENMKVDKPPYILIGDFNINIHNLENYAEIFLTSLQCVGLQQLIKTCTRVTDSSASRID